jgi:hypothetical protein
MMAVYFLDVCFVQNEVKQLTAENEELKSTMQVEKERLHALEAAMEELHKRGIPFIVYYCLGLWVCVFVFFSLFPKLFLNDRICSNLKRN